MKIDSIDAKILYLLGKNSRLSISSLAKAINRNREFVTFRIERLKKLDIILGTNAIINYQLLGLYHVKILIKVKGATKSKLTELENYLLTNDVFTNVQKTFGRWDYLARMRAETLEEIMEILDKLSTDYRDILKISHFFILEEHGPGWTTLINKKDKPKMPNDKIAFTSSFSKSKKKRIKLDELDKKLILALSENARVNSLDLAEDFSVSYKTIVNRIKKLVLNKIIEGFGVKGKISQFGYSRRTIFVKLANISQNYERANRFFNNMEECSRFWRLGGPLNYQLNINIKTTEDFEQVLNKIRTYFKEDLIDIESLDVLKQIKETGLMKV